MPPTDPDLDARLAAMDRDQLEALARRLVDRAPQVVDLAFLPLPGERQRADRRHVVAQVLHILETMGDDWQASTRAEQELWPLVTLGEQYLEQGALEDARTVFTAIIEPILANYEQLRDEESELAGIVELCVQGLGRCLEATRAPAARQALLADVFAVYRWDAIDHGSYGMDGPPQEVMRAQATGPERALLAAWARQAMPAGSSRQAWWGRTHAGRLVLELVGEGLDAGERERLLAEAGLDRERLELLLTQGRHEEALALVRDHPGGDLADLADRLVAVGLGDAARRIVAEHPAVLGAYGDRTRAWLRRQGVALPDNLDALVWALQLFERDPSIRKWQELREEAERAGRWPAALAVLGPLDPSRPALQPLRARLCAAQGDVERALAELEGLSASTWKSAALDVAASLEGSHPAAAAALIQRLVQVLRAHGTKPARMQAAELEARWAALAARQA